MELRVKRSRLDFQYAIAVLIMLAALVFSGCGQPAPVALKFNSAPWQSGERHTFDVIDKDGKRSGTATFTIDEGKSDTGEAMWVIERAVSAQGDVETITVKVTEQGFRPVSSYLERTHADSTETVDTQYNQGQVDLTLNTRENNMTTQLEQIPSDARETITLPMIVRALPLAKGYATQLNTLLPRKHPTRSRNRECNRR